MEKGADLLQQLLRRRLNQQKVREGDDRGLTGGGLRVWGEGGKGIGAGTGYVPVDASGLLVKNGSSQGA